MELKLVYRALRKISDWTLTGYYSEVYIEGQENVPKDGPLIIASTHHNEIVDVAVLAATIPHRRHLSFWAKSTLFSNPILGAILYSSGSIPVKRNPNGNSARSAEGDPASVQATLFRETSIALANGDAVGVFVEGTSCTVPSVALLRDGAAYAAVEYLRWENTQGDARGPTSKEGLRKGLVIVPVGIVYTEKKRFQSRVHIKYGKPIRINDYAKDILSTREGDATSRATIKKLTSAIETQLLQSTANAQDWDIFHSALMARDILWRDERHVCLKDYVEVLQTLCDIFTDIPGSPSSASHLNLRIKKSLVKYSALLHYTGISHASLASLYPSAPEVHPSVVGAFFAFLGQVIRFLLHPRNVLFLPMAIIHLPGYVLGTLAARVIPRTREEEAMAMYKVLIGGLGIALSYTTVAFGLVKWLMWYGTDQLASPLWSKGMFGYLGQKLVSFGVSPVAKSIGLLLAGREGLWKRTNTIFGVVYATAWVLAKWHNVLVGSNYRHAKRLTASLKIFLGLLFPRSSDVVQPELQSYLRPPPPWFNPMIKQRYPTATNSNSTVDPASFVDPPPMASRRLVRHLLAARSEATTGLLRHLVVVERGGRKDMVSFLRNKGAMVNL